MEQEKEAVYLINDNKYLHLRKNGAGVGFATYKRMNGELLETKTLLTIINDVLDFSKIESGKMDIEETEYEPMSVINDVSNMIMTRVMDKDVELILDIAPDLPRKLYGDSNRIKQIMINIANNAVKFTKEGQVVLKVGFECIGEEEILLLISVSDTGIGIKKEDMERLFARRCLCIVILDEKNNGFLDSGEPIRIGRGTANHEGLCSISSSFCHINGFC